MSAARVVISGAALVALGAGSAVAQSINRGVDALPMGEVVISVSVGNLTVRGWDQGRVEVAGELGAGMPEFELMRNGEQVIVRVITDSESVEQRDRGRTDIYVSVPSDSRLVVVTSSADMLIAGVHGAQSLRSVSGDIETEAWSALIEAESVGGDIGVSGREGPANAMLSTVNGEIEVRGPFERLAASTVSGDIELDILDVTSMQLNTTNGEIEVRATLRDEATLDAETINGDVDLEIGEDGNLHLDLGTFSGRIENCFGYEVTRSTGASGRELRYVGDAEAPRVRVRTLNGDIEVCTS
jgi:DUF4097 and DUF4098 domain-containing protein YvlB